MRCISDVARTARKIKFVHNGVDFNSIGIRFHMEGAEYLNNVTISGIMEEDWTSDYS